ncbi:polysaccharide deacetylase family protein [Halovulum dunhuangense]|uniref:Chitooligosaccharide deacetylase n=1 Tax=Halovulum dunhuangense TaxID=1505036 RepID=A0A849KVG4_9RHOB|nr:polysaccharide deacetylase family protein [Halovulum dunhuangense]NNU79055.1 polysaccharide deacetylase family protein [Halovulum dunhuangense]
MPETQVERVPLYGDLVWPGGRRIAVVFNLAWEMWMPGATSGVGPMGNVLANGCFDPNADSYGHYNATAGIRRLTRIMERHGIAASLLTSGLVAGRFPDAVRASAESGHDIVAHGLGQNLVFPTLSPDQAQHSIQRTTELIEAATGKTPKGWISPRVTSAAGNQRNFARAGYLWHGDVIDDDLPYIQRFGDAEILAIPMSVEFNDLPHAMRFGRTPGQFVTLVTEALDAIKRQPAETIILDIFAHGHCYGRPAAAWAIDDIARACASDDALWITTRSEIADHCRAALPLLAE